MSKLLTYDKTEEFKAEIEPKMKEIKKICIKYNIPFISVFASANTADATQYITEGLFPGVQGIKLHDDKLKDVFGIMSGYSEPDAADFSDDDDDEFPDEV